MELSGVTLVHRVLFRPKQKHQHQHHQSSIPFVWPKREVLVSIADAGDGGEKSVETVR